MSIYKKVILAILVAVLAVTGGIGLSYLIKENRDANHVSNNPPASGGGGLTQEKSASNNDDLHPYTIEALRRREYPGSEIVIDRELGDQGAFKSYVISYQSDGFKLNALMNVPDMPKPEGGFPVIILNHGFIEPTVYDTINSYKSYMDAYSRQGLIVVKPDYRGHDNSEGEPVSAHTSADYMIDVLNAVSSIKKYPDANPNKIGMWGHSMGGGITLRALAISKDIKAAVLLAGVVAAPTTFYNYWQQNMNKPGVPSWIKENADRTLKEFGAPSANTDLWNAISPYSYLGDFSAPVQIHHGTGDTDVPIVFSEELNQALMDAGKPVEYFGYPNGDHNLAGSARGPVLTRTIEFFRVNLNK